MVRRITNQERRARLARRHLLLPELRTDDVVSIVRALVALHSSDPVTVYLSALARMRRPDVAAVDTALYEARTLLRHHAMRRTLWVTTPAMARTMHAAATRKVAHAEHRRTVGFLADNEILQPEAWLDRARASVCRLLADHGPMTAREIGRRVPELARPLQLARGKRYAATQGAHTRVLAGLGFDGVLVRGRPTGTWVNGQYTWSLMEDWLPGGVDGADERTAARDLARAWLERFGPGTSGDLQWWAGWTVATTRRALADCGAVEVELDSGPGWVAPEDAEDSAGQPPWVALLPALDPTAMGWKERSFYLPPQAAPAWDRNGNAGPTIWVDGQVVGLWGQAADGEIRLHWFVEVEPGRRAEVAARARELRGWLGEVRFRPRFAPPLHAQLVGDA